MILSSSVLLYYHRKCLEVTVVVNSHYINTIELKKIENYFHK